MDGSLRAVRGPVLAACLSGAAIGLLSPRTLYSVEIAQVMAGVVTLPPSVPIAIHHGRVFSIVIDAAALLLALGLSDEMVCRIFTALMGSLAYISLSVAAFAFTRSRTAAYLMPWLMYGYNLGADAHRYPIHLPITQGDLGPNGLSAALLAVGLIALRAPAGAFLLGLLPAVHASWAVGIWLLVAAGVCVDREARIWLLRQRWRFATGLGLTAVAWMVHQLLAPSFPSGPESVDLRLVRAFMRYGDHHRAPLDLEGIGAWLWAFAPDIAFFALAGASLATPFARRLGVRFWLAGAFAMSIAALGNSLVDQIAPGALPVPVAALMMSRWLNFNTVVMPSLAIGLLWHLTGSTQRAWLRTPAARMLACAVAALPVAPALLHRLDQPFRNNFGPAEERTLLQQVGQRPGLLLSHPELRFVQLRTRRALLIDVTLIDVLPYAPAASAAMEAILNDVHGASLLTPEGLERLEHVEARWVAMSQGEWVDLGRRYGVTDILVPVAWKALSLPLVATAGELALYSIPSP